MENRSNYISTNNNEYDNGIEKVAYTKLFKNGNASSIKSIDHSHPGGTPPSGYTAAGSIFRQGHGDKEFAKWVYRYYPNNAPNIKLRVYNPKTNDYTRYTNRQILSR